MGDYRSPALSQKAYPSWRKMKDRCFNPNDTHYDRYGGRGIGVCDKWLSYEGFMEDMGAGYKKGLTLDRIDNNGDYEPSNCRWATRKEQANNRRNNILFTWDGMKKTMTGWAEHLGVSQSTLSQRYYVYGWSLDKTLNTPVRRYRG